MYQVIASGNSYKFSMPETAVNSQNVWYNVSICFMQLLRISIEKENYKIFDQGK